MNAASAMTAPTSNAVVPVDPSGPPFPSHPILDKLRFENNYNPKEFDLSPPNARFFIIKSYSEDDIHRSIKYSIWCSTEHGNKRLDNAFKSQEGKGNVYLLFSVNSSGHFCGMAQMVSGVDYNSTSSVWAQDKWKGQFKVKWVYVKDVPNAQLRHIRLENNENKPVTNSRDTQEVPYEKEKQFSKLYTIIVIQHPYSMTFYTTREDKRKNIKGVLLAIRVLVQVVKHQAARKRILPILLFSPLPHFHKPVLRTLSTSKVLTNCFTTKVW